MAERHTSSKEKQVPTNGSEGDGGGFDWTKTVSALLAISTFFYGIVQYKDQDQRLYRQKIYEERFMLYSELLDLSARLSATPPDSVLSVRFPQMSSEFDRLYFGKMNMIQDTTVERLMKEFKKTKDLYQAGAPEVTPEIFQNSSIKLGLACRESLLQTQVIEFPAGEKKGS